MRFFYYQPFGSSSVTGIESAMEENQRVCPDYGIIDGPEHILTNDLNVPNRHHSLPQC